MATRSEKRKAATSIVLNLVFIAAVVAGISVAAVTVLHAAVVGAALPVIVIIGLLVYIAVKRR